MKDRWHIALQAAVIAGAAIVAGIEWWDSWSRSDYEDTASVQSTERNERSTPRSFVLPATPAVALEQEHQLAQKTNSRSAAKCVWELRVRGFAVPINEDLFDVKLVEAIFEFQRANGITPTGRLDQPTKEALKC